MGYVIAADYRKAVQDQVLKQITGDDAAVLRGAEMVAEREIRSYLEQKYDLQAEFKSIETFDPGKRYKALDRVITDNGSIYFVGLPTPEFDYYGQYVHGDRVWWRDMIYTCQQASRGLTASEAIQYMNIQSLPLRNIFPDDRLYGRQFWGVGEPYSVEPVAEPGGSGWAKGDNRNPQLVQLYVDIVIYHLCSRIAPQNVPKVREDRYNHAIEWLKDAAEGRITAGLKLLPQRKAARIRFGGNVKLVNSY